LRKSKPKVARSPQVEKANVSTDENKQLLLDVEKKKLEEENNKRNEEKQRKEAEMKKQKDLEFDKRREQLAINKPNNKNEKERLIPFDDYSQNNNASCDCCTII